MGAGAGNVCCPPAIQPPTPQLAKCKRILQILAVVLIPVLVLSLLVGQGFTFFIYIFLMLFLVIGWRSLNWCAVMFFFLYCIMQIIQSTILIIGFIEYDRFLTKKYMLQSCYLIVQELYFMVAIFLSHFVYKQFKAFLNVGFIPQNNNLNENLNQNNNINHNQNHNIQGNPFQGQGVRIG